MDYRFMRDNFIFVLVSKSISLKGVKGRNLSTQEVYKSDPQLERGRRTQGTIS